MPQLSALFKTLEEEETHQRYPVNKCIYKCNKLYYSFCFHFLQYLNKLSYPSAVDTYRVFREALLIVFNLFSRHLNCATKRALPFPWHYSSASYALFQHWNRELKLEWEWE